MTNRCMTATMLVATLVMWGARPAIAAQGRSPCPPPPKLEASSTSVDTKTALDLATKILGKIGIDANFKTTRDSIFKDNPRADQAAIVLTMANTLCEMIWSDTALSGGEKATRFQAMMQDMLSRALGPASIARTDAPKRSWFEGWGNKIVLAAADPLPMQLVELNEPAFKLPETQTGFLRDPPFYVTDANKYFVIVGSAQSRQQGLSLMNRFKAKAPQYEFALYGPYGDNPYFGVMMASWVPRDVAAEALRLARRDVVPDAYLWACRSTGERC